MPSLLIQNILLLQYCSIQVQYGEVWGAVHGKESGTRNLFELTSPITDVTGRCGDFVDQLTFTEKNKKQSVCYQ